MFAIRKYNVKEMEVNVMAKKNNKKRQVVEVISVIEINRWKKYFSVYGRKTQFQDSTGISRQSLNNILNLKRGVERVTKIIRDYYDRMQ